MQVAARFATNWLQIWHFNPTIMHPDSALPPNTLINIGHLYEVLLFLIWPRVVGTSVTLYDTPNLKADNVHGYSSIDTYSKTGPYWVCRVVYRFCESCPVYGLSN